MESFDGGIVTHAPNIAGSIKTWCERVSVKILPLDKTPSAINFHCPKNSARA